MATPIVTETVRSGGIAGKAVQAMRSRIRSAMDAAPLASVSGTTSMNSSPPYRPNTSLARRPTQASDAKCASTASPAGWPYRSFTLLKWSMSNRQIDSGEFSRTDRLCSRSSVSNRWRRLYTPVNTSRIASCSMRLTASVSVRFVSASRRRMRFT
jgi:hypothetical protein